MKLAPSSLVCLLIPVIIPVLQSSSEASEISVTYRFQEPLVEKLDRDFSRVIFPATVQAGRAGGPAYPFRGAQILLPPGEVVSNVRVEKRDWTVITGKHRLYPRQHPLPGIEADRPERTFLYNSAAYEVDRWIHPPSSEFSTQYLRGHSIAVGSFSPVGFHPAAGDVGYFKKVVVIIETVPGTNAGRSLDFLRTDAETCNRISRLVDNPEAISHYGDGRPYLGADWDRYEYLIITRQDLEDDFTLLRDFYTRRGLRSRIMTMEHIESNFDGIDGAEKVRNAIIHEYTTHGITHVLLGGDGDGAPEDPKTVPYRGLYCGVVSIAFYEDGNIPADLYFAALDGDWNSDGDSLWGEAGEEDFYSEISIGRACVDTPDEVATFINKTTMYQDTPVAGQVRRSLLLGEKMWNDPETYGGNEMDQLVGTCTAYGFTTTGIPPGFDITKYYDRDLGSWSKTDLMNAVNAGTNWLVHAGHCNRSYAMRLVLSDITDVNFTNDGINANFPIINSYGCYAGAFDNRSTSTYYPDDCIGEEMVKIEHFGAAFLGNSRYGWFTEGTTNGPSHHFQREFYDALFTEGYTMLGAANQRSKDETAPFVDLPGEYEPGAHRWCFYTLNLIGDPALDGWTNTPDSLSVTHPDTMGRYDSAIEVETGNAGSSAALYWDGTCYGKGSADITGHIELARTRLLPETINLLELNVVAHNHYVRRDTVIIDDGITLSEDILPKVTLEQNTPNPFNPFTVIRFTLEKEGPVDLRIYDAAGREVDRLINREMPGGAHAYNWRPDNLPSGVYFCVLRANGARISRKAVLLR